MANRDSFDSWRQRLSHADPRERLRAVNDIERLGKRAVPLVPLLVDALKDRDAQVRGAILLTLVGIELKAPGTVGPAATAALPVLQKLLKPSASGDYSGLAAARILGVIGPAAASAAPKIASLLARADEVDASYLAGHLARLGPQAVPHLIAALSNGKSHVRSSAASALGTMGSAAADAVPALIKLLADKPPARTFAAGALGAIASRADIAVPALLGAVDDEEHEFRRAALTSLGQFGPAASAAVPVLLPFLEDPDWPWWHYLAAEALGRIGPAAAPALPSLRKLLKSKDRQIREQAAQAIDFISQSPVPAAIAENRKRPGPGDNLFDFARTKKVVAAMIAEGVARFAREHPDEEVACVAIFSRGFSAMACLCIGTSAEVPANLKHGGAYGFKYAEYAQEIFEWWPDLYKVGSDFNIKLPDGEILRRSTDKNGNDAIDKPLFKLLVETLTEALPFKKLNRARKFRVGVEMHDSSCVKFWPVK